MTLCRRCLIAVRCWDESDRRDFVNGMRWGHESLAALRRSAVILAVMGPALHDEFTAGREAELRAFQDMAPETVAAAHRWRY